VTEGPSIEGGPLSYFQVEMPPTVLRRSLCDAAGMARNKKSTDPQRSAVRALVVVRDSEAVRQAAMWGAVSTPGGSGLHRAEEAFLGARLHHQLSGERAAALPREATVLPETPQWYPSLPRTGPVEPDLWLATHKVMTVKCGLRWSWAPRTVMETHLTLPRGDAVSVAVSRTALEQAAGREFGPYAAQGCARRGVLMEVLVSIDGHWHHLADRQQLLPPIGPMPGWNKPAAQDIHAA